MARVLLVLIGIIFSADIFSAKNVQEMEINDAPLKLVGFKWESCDSNPMLKIKDFRLSPDPIKSGGLENMSLSIEVDESFGGAGQKISGNLKVEFDEGQGRYIDLCMLKPEYCVIDDICALMASYQQMCNAVLKPMKLECKCPIQKGTYTVNNLLQKLPSIPSGASGKFRITGRLQINKSKDVTCVVVNLCLNHC